ncbi:hypothetical protein F5Y10DRAFT_293144 [Nemania abortiva]|nr:hypothetical protein F5Y10DRAFT_293144 [Nemania abortiva]
MSQPSQPHSWLQHQQVIEKLLVGVKERNIVSALYLYGPPTSGLNTTLVDHVIQQALNGRAPQNVLYIAGTELGQELIAERPSLEPHMGRNFVVKSAYEICDDFQQGRRLPCKLVLMIEVRMSATVAEEIMFGVVLRQLRDLVRAKRDSRAEGHVAVLLLGSSWFSERTFESFRKLMQTEKRCIQNTLLPINFTNPENLDHILGQALSKGKRVVFSKAAEWTYGTEFTQVADYRDNFGEPIDVPILPQARTLEGDHASKDYKYVKKSLCFQVDPQSLFSTSTNVSIVVSGDRVTTHILDLVTSQVVQVERQLTRCELENAQAWARMATEPVQFFADYRPEILQSLKDGDECLGPAWTTQVATLVLQTLHTLGDDGNIPIRRLSIRIPANHVAWADRFRRLEILGCLQENPNKHGAYLLTSRGKSMLELTGRQGLGWEVAWLLMSASDAHLDDTARRVVVHIAAVVACEPDTFVAKRGTLKSDGEPYTIDDLQKLCAPILRPCASHGMLWLYTGILLRRPDATYPSGQNSYIEIRKSKVEIIIDMAQKFAAICKLGPSQNQHWTETPLSEQQVSGINQALTWAFLHHTVYFEEGLRDQGIRKLPEDTYFADDCVSLQDLRIDQGAEFLDIEEWRAPVQRDTVGGGFHAICDRITRLQDGDDTCYYASGLTLIPPAALREVAAEVGIPWPGLVMRTLS